MKYLLLTLLLMGCGCPKPPEEIGIVVDWEIEQNWDRTSCTLILKDGREIFLKYAPLNITTGGMLYKTCNGYTMLN